MTYTIEQTKESSRIDNGAIITQRAGFVLRWRYAADHFGASFHQTQKSLHCAIAARKRVHHV